MSYFIGYSFLKPHSFTAFSLNKYVCNAQLCNTRNCSVHNASFLGICLKKISIKLERIRPKLTLWSICFIHLFHDHKIKSKYRLVSYFLHVPCSKKTYSCEKNLEDYLQKGVSNTKKMRFYEAKSTETRIYLSIEYLSFEGVLEPCLLKAGPLGPKKHTWPKLYISYTDASISLPQACFMK